MLFLIYYFPFFFGLGFNFLVLFPSLHIPYIDPLLALASISPIPKTCIPSYSTCPKTAMFQCLAPTLPPLLTLS